MPELSDDDLKDLLAKLDPNIKRLPTGVRLFARVVIEADRALHLPALPRALALLSEMVNLCAVGDIDENSDHEGWAGLVRDAKALIASDLCDDCPPTGCPTGKTRCKPCPRRTQAAPVAPAEAAPPGWQLVPVEPTQEMLRTHSENVYGLNEWKARNDWACMLAAAPHPATAGTTDAGGV